MDRELMLALRPKITPQAALRMHMQYVAGVAVTTATLGMIWSTTFWEVWQNVMFPDGARK